MADFNKGMITGIFGVACGIGLSAALFGHLGWGSVVGGLIGPTLIALLVRIDHG